MEKLAYDRSLKKGAAYMPKKKSKRESDTVKRKSSLPEKVWKELKKKKNVDEWDPTEKDVNWLLNTVRIVKIGGLWNLPAVNVTFEKVGQNHLRLKSIETDDLLNAMIAIEKTKKVGEKAGIKVDIEKTADYVFLRL